MTSQSDPLGVAVTVTESLNSETVGFMCPEGWALLVEPDMFYRFTDQIWTNLF
jgi:hypothetical protein